MAILFGTPNNRGSISTSHFQMVVQFMEYMRAKRPKMPVHHKVANCTVVGFARNALASVVYVDPQYSHLVLVDPDISVAPETLAEMVDADLPVVAAPYPTREWDRQAFVAAARRIEDAAVAEAVSATYVGGDGELMLTPAPGGGSKPIVRGRLARVKSCGAGVLVVKREAFLAVAAKRPDLLLREVKSDYWKIGYKGDTVLECFEYAGNLRSDQAVEGAGFAKLWTGDCAGEIWTALEASVTRSGEYRFVGHFASKLKLGLI
ncbi:hypothetical protein [Oharaeibacter diazotrophicus]|uniref:Glycosyl transferase family 2 n=1 Tax=Oharaeibacter diazotrophicus TaxID=1920512 RepID=A0A4R6RLV1_9HYPH|nr:hypothetical protein [Oharaeibacter diazotrophicus]TDP87649.1 hypothetical protein EDD54_1548 [Oharaeibacter diazotrophicus]BBE74767.1 hypothetical protein OHA_1_04404 [Pleomorphomonas sp. SM30]GLS77150.1 hypothetical protein GCM10007904_24870 [Oharaeibacter diazotrophicus]